VVFFILEKGLVVMRNIFFIKAILCMALFFGYSNIWGQYDESYKASKLAESKKKAAERAAARVSKESTTAQPGKAWRQRGAICKSYGETSG